MVLGRLGLAGQEDWYWVPGETGTGHSKGEVCWDELGKVTGTWTWMVGNWDCLEKETETGSQGKKCGGKTGSQWIVERLGSD